MQRLEVSGAVRPLYGSLGVKGLMKTTNIRHSRTKSSRPGDLAPEICTPLNYSSMLYSLR